MAQRPPFRLGHAGWSGRGPLNTVGAPCACIRMADGKIPGAESFMRLHKGRIAEVSVITSVTNSKRDTHKLWHHSTGRNVVMGLPRLVKASPRVVRGKTESSAPTTVTHGSTP
jgi:hypothetical protein